MIGANLTVPIFIVVLRKAYGLGRAGDGRRQLPGARLFAVAWPTGEFGGMGLEGAVKLGYRNELAAIEDPARAAGAPTSKLVAELYERGKALNIASVFELDDVIDPADTRRWIVAGLRAAPPPARRATARSGRTSIPGDGEPRLMRLSRRALLAATAAVPFAAKPFNIVRAAPAFGTDPFTLGVASGYPRPDGVVLWTRLAPDPLNGGGMPDQPVEVDWEIAEDERFDAHRRARQRPRRSPSALAHSVHVEVRGLRPGRLTGTASAPAARPARSAARAPRRPRRQRPARLRLRLRLLPAIRAGLLHAPIATWRARTLDLVVHLGDYIYELSWGARPCAQARHRRSDRRSPSSATATRSTRATPTCRRRTPRSRGSSPGTTTRSPTTTPTTARRRTRDRDCFLARRAAAYQAYYEHMPLPAAMAAARAGARASTTATASAISPSFMLLDDRQYRSHQACARRRAAAAAAPTAPSASTPRARCWAPRRRAGCDGRLRRSSRHAGT